MQKIVALFFMSLIIYSCKNDIENKVDLSNVDVSFALKRFDVDFYNNSAKNLQELKKEYPVLFPENVHDSVWNSKKINTDEQELFQETQKIFNNIEELKANLTSFFKHVKYYNPKFKSPNVITMLTNIDYDSRVVYVDSLLLISLDAYLGKNHKFYGDYPEYIKVNNHKGRVVVDVARNLVNKQILGKMPRTFIGKMINKGKKMFVLDSYLPDVLNEYKIGYAEEKYKWAVANEEQIWQYFIEKNLLFSTDKNLDRRFLEVAPFSKFYMEEDNRSPGRIGEWIGWQIVKAYMRNNDVSLHELIRTDEETIFKKSKYKPRR
ncbi:Gliding motility lipoprotein precursor GldB [Tenacibaculum sp. 190524A02b]